MSVVGRAWGDDDQILPATKPPTKDSSELQGEWVRLCNREEKARRAVTEAKAKLDRARSDKLIFTRDNEGVY